MREIFESTIERLLADLVTPQLLRAGEAGTWPADLWTAMEESGFAVAAAPETQGGAGASWEDLVVVVQAAGRHHLPLPLPETLLANAVLAECGMAVINAPLGLAAGGDLSLYSGRVTGTLRDVPWGRHVDQVVAVIGGNEPLLVLLERSAASCSPKLNTAGEPRDDLHFDAAVPLATALLPRVLSPDVLHLGGAMLRCAQIAGALGQVLELTSRYATERVQFGKPIGSFQAIQHQIAVLSEHSGAATVAAECAFAESGNGAAQLAALPIAAAKICASEACGLAAGIAHTVHGAIGFTHEHALHMATRRLWSWRSEFGNSTHWSQRLGRAVCDGSSVGLWPAITSGRIELPVPA